MEPNVQPQNKTKLIGGQSVTDWTVNTWEVNGVKHALSLSWLSVCNITCLLCMNGILLTVI